MIALIPARFGSKRIPGKNLRPLGGKPLILWTLEAAYDSEVFDQVYISTDSAEIAEVAVSHTGCRHIQRPAHMAQDDSPDIDWVKHALGTIAYRWLDEAEDFAILRPTAPYRGPEAIQRAKVQWDDLKALPRRFRYGEQYRWGCDLLPVFDSMRAIRATTESPWKMWRYAEDTHEIDPITTVSAKKHLHSRPTQELEDTWVQTAGLEMAWSRTPLELGTIAGERIAGFVLEGPEALDLNTEDDWKQAEALLHHEPDCSTMSGQTAACSCHVSSLRGDTQDPGLTQAAIRAGQTRNPRQAGDPS